MIPRGPAPLSLVPSTFETNEYKAQATGWTNSVNFLQAIKASDAYARGYSGYKVNRNTDGSLKEITDPTKKAYSDNDYITNEKVKVAVFDEGVWTSHTDLDANMGTGLNFVYGACSSTNKGKCWEFWPADGTNTCTNASNQKVDCVVLYDNWADTENRQVLTAKEMSEAEWLAYKQQYSGYVYSANNANPVVYKVWQSSDGSENLKRYKAGDVWYLVDANNVAHACASGTSCSYGDKTYTAVDEYMNHGTHVSGLIAAEKNDEGMMGVAYNAEIIPVKMDFDIQTFEGFAEATQVADIVNLSLGYGGVTDGMHYSKAQAVNLFNNVVLNSRGLREGFMAAAENETILVFSAGNYLSGTTGVKPFDPSVYAYAPLSDYFNGTVPLEFNTYNLTNLVVNVVALNDTGMDLAWYSARCGDTMTYCVGAPGGTDSNIYSTARVAQNGTSADWGYLGAMGTSMAAPIVSGALAVIKGAFPHLTNQQIVQILFESADYMVPTEAQISAAISSGAGYETGEDGLGHYNSIYGRGAIDLDEATRPLGVTTIALGASTTGNAVPTSASSSVVPSMFAGVTKALPAKMIILDKYQRAFTVPTASFMRVAKRENKFDARFKSFMSGDEKVVAKTDTLRMAYSERYSKLASQMPKGSVSFELTPTPKWSFKTFYSENTATNGGTYFERLLASPYGKMKEAWGGSLGYKLSGNWQTDVQGQVGQNGFVDEKDLSRMKHNRMSLFQGSVKYTGLKKVELKAVAGVAEEQGSLFGMWGRGAFKTGNSKTTYVGTGLTLNLTDALKLEGMYYSGSTKVNQANSLVQMSTVKSDSFAVTAAWQMDDNRSVGVHVMSPLRVRSGNARVSVPVARDAYQDFVYQETTEASLKPSAREYDIGFSYTDASLHEDVLLKSEFGVRLNPDHIAGSAPDWRALVGVHWGL